MDYTRYFVTIDNKWRQENSRHIVIFQSESRSRGGRGIVEGEPEKTKRNREEGRKSYVGEGERMLVETL